MAKQSVYFTTNCAKSIELFVDKISCAFHTHTVRVKKTVIGISPKIPVAIVLLVLMAMFTRDYLHEAQIKKQVSAARTDAEKTVDPEIERRESFLRKSGIINKKIASSKVDVCLIEAYAKLKYQQRCYLRYVDGFEADMDNLTFGQKLQMLEASDKKKRS